MKITMQSLVVALSLFLFGLSTAHAVPQKKKTVHKKPAAHAKTETPMDAAKIAVKSADAINAPPADTQSCADQTTRSPATVDEPIDASHLIQITANAPGTKNCPNAAQIMALKLMIANAYDSGASLMCQDVWTQIPALQDYMAKNPQIFDPSFAARDKALALFHLSFNRLKTEFKYDSMNDDAVSYFAKALPAKEDRHAIDNAGVPAASRGGNDRQCQRTGEDIAKLLTVSDLASFKAVVAAAPYANDSAIWNGTLRQIHDKAGIGACVVPDTTEN